MDDARPVRIAVAANEAVALLWRGLLTAEGIPVIVRVAGPGIAYFTPALCEHYLYVRAADAGRARQLLDDYAARPDEIAQPGTDDSEPT